MKATDVLMEEHRAIEQVLNALEHATARLTRGEEVYGRFFSGTLAFFKLFVDECHHFREEQQLFPAMIENGISRETGPIAVMLAEHEQGRLLVGKIRQQLDRLPGGDARAREEFIKLTTAYRLLLQQHIQKEDKILFPLADRVIPAAQQAQLAEEFNQAALNAQGENVHEKFYSLANRLMNESMR